MRSDIDPRDLVVAMNRANVDEPVRLHLSDASLFGLKFSAALPMELARRTIAVRLTDQLGARAALGDRRMIAAAKASNS
jgi:hypothetical protein